ncbi:unnamed protein product [Kuraishia capsulata CBS 1993]|uniref:Scaffold protein Nfu/NifU N-terminal domain-containing protein n=1 Tax=Kuraishia capsulata CBS 1993 TaxID=1382522 RepID=W6MIL9_9ASCO|nr:uncharacterized protein KUCA_T00001738001 [Kuraishia capsulata CBS 1993]CDK25768.1 unnamed protein product [Kuraishia capsulata CBS 1993]
MFTLSNRLAQRTSVLRRYAGVRSLFIQTQTTPNESALKFLPSIKVLQNETTIEFLSGREASKSPLALRLFAIDGVKSVMLGPDFITVEKTQQVEDWSLLKPGVFAILTEFLNSGEKILDEDHVLEEDVMFDDNDDEVVSMIKELIFTRIRPAIRDDGGDIEFVDFVESEGKVLLRLRGACRSCDSSSITLKNGIESMLKHYIEEVQTVEQIDDGEGEAEVAAKEAEKPKFQEAKITPRQREFNDAPPSL